MGAGIVVIFESAGLEHGQVAAAQHVGKESNAVRASLGGTAVDLIGFEQAMSIIVSAAETKGIHPLAVASANLDHVLHFGHGGRWAGTLAPDKALTWLTLLDGAPLRTKAGKMTGVSWPRLAGSDLIGPLLDEAERLSLRVGFLGGTEQNQDQLRLQLAISRPDLIVSGWWAPDRQALADSAASSRLAAEVEAARTDILVVGLGKPRQELWISQHGERTGARVLLAFGAVVDFLSGRLPRAPGIVANAGFEWAWRLGLEPRRLAKRYLVDGPEAYLRLQRSSVIHPNAVLDHGTPDNRRALNFSTSDRSRHTSMAPPLNTSKANDEMHYPGRFVPINVLADVTVVVVTFNNADDVDDLILDLRAESDAQSLKVIVADNCSSDNTLERLAAYPDVIVVRTGGNLGYAGGINAALHHGGPFSDVLVLNPDLRVMPGAIEKLRHRLISAGAAIVVPKLLDEDTTTYPSLRREPGVLRSLGDAAFGRRFPGRPTWLSEIDYAPESYDYAHQVDWATGAALLIDAKTAKAMGSWDERFFLYSEETDYCRRVRDGGGTIWFEPAAVMRHSRGGSGTSAELTALMAVNRVRYAEKHLEPWQAGAMRATVLLSEAARFWQPAHRNAVKHLLDANHWDKLPGPVEVQLNSGVFEHFPSGSVIIPAHNEESVIRRTLASLRPAIETGQLEVVVACNGCTDKTSEIAKSFAGVLVLDIVQASKVAALNAADAAAEKWPRLYLDADVEIGPAALRMVLEQLANGQVLAARPAFRYDDDGADWVVRSFYRARRRMPSTREALWGAGAYGLTRDGHQRFAAFPPFTADDLFVDRQFTAAEKVVLNSPPVKVRTPRQAARLLAILRRNYRGQAELREDTAPGLVAGLAGARGGDGRDTLRTAQELARSVRGPVSAMDAAVYASMVMTARLSGRIRSGRTSLWERDESSR